MTPQELAIKYTLEQEIKRLDGQLTSLLELRTNQTSGSEMDRINGKIEGVCLAIENLRQTISQL